MKPQGFELFGNYLLMDRFAYGGMAEVFYARPRNLGANGRIVVLKRILSHVATEPEFRGMFESEIQVCMGFNHPNIIHIHDFGTVEDHPFIAMEFVQGKNLRELVHQYGKQSKRISIPVALSIATQTATALQYAHEFKNPATGEDLRVIHRDVSPQNILLSYDGNIKLIDFGIARPGGHAGDMTLNGTIKGKPSYISPEQIYGLDLDGRADVFSLGVILWELLAGEKLFTLLSGNEYEILNLIQNSDRHIQKPSKYNGDIPPELDAIVMKALANDREKRYASAREFRRALRDYLLKNYPGFGYQDVASAMSGVFAEEKIEECMLLRTLNEEAQLYLRHHQSEGTSSYTLRMQVFNPPAEIPLEDTSGSLNVSSFSLSWHSLIHYQERMRKKTLIAALVVGLTTALGAFGLLRVTAAPVAENSHRQASEEPQVQSLAPIVPAEPPQLTYLRLQFSEEDQIQVEEVRLNGFLLDAKKPLARVPANTRLQLEVRLKGERRYSQLLELPEGPMEQVTLDLKLPQTLERAPAAAYQINDSESL